METVVLDLSVILLLVFFCILGFKKGIIRSFFSFLNLFVSLMISTYISSGISETVYENFIKANVTNQLKNSLNSKGLFSASIFQSVPKFISNSFSYYGITEETLTNIINSGKDNVAEQLESVIAPIFIHTICVALELILFFTFMFGIGWIFKILVKIFRINIIRPIDSSLGGVFGFLKGYLICVITVFCIRIWSQVTDSIPQIFSYENIECTYVFKHIYTNNIVWNLTQEIFNANTKRG